MRKKWLVFTILLLIVIGAVVAQEQPVFRIGVLDNERGPIAKGARLAVSQINARGGVTGADDTRYRLELIIVPPDNNLGVALSTITDAGVIAILGPLTTQDAMENIRLLPLAEVTILTPALGDTLIITSNSERIFRSRAAQRHQGRALASFLYHDLQITDVHIAQLDTVTIEAMVGFSTAYSSLGGVNPELHLFEVGTELGDLVEDVVVNTPQAVVAYGAPEMVADFYTALRASGWSGLFAYNNASMPEFRDRIPIEELTGVLGTTTWSAGARDAVSVQFLVDYVQAFGEVPGAVQAAAYDSVYLIRQALGQPGALEDNLAAIDGFRGVQGILSPAAFERGEISNNVVVIQLGPLGGAEIVARFTGPDRLTDEDLPGVVDAGTPVSAPTATLEGVYITIRNNVQNVRTGPGLSYDVLGQMQQGETARVIGATTDYAWVVIEYRGQQGWLATYLLDLAGDRSTVPVVAIPPTPTLNPTQIIETNITPTPANFADIIIVVASPIEIPVNTATTINVTVRNAGGVAAGPFAIAASYMPGSVYSAYTFTAGLPPGGELTVPLTVQLGGPTGNYETVIVADLNDDVPEGPAGEANNTNFVHRYRLDRPTIWQNFANLTVGQTIDLEGGTADLRLDTNGLNIAGTACTVTPTPNSCVGVLPGFNWETAHYGIVTPEGGVNTTVIPNSSLTPGTVIGVVTAEGRRAILRIDNFAPGSSLSFTYRVYQ
jgi:ABC-type branched-subunit amino acid transport system substrate-binding protein/SH3-like domain-containing protein